MIWIFFSEAKGKTEKNICPPCDCTTTTKIIKTPCVCPPNPPEPKIEKQPPTYRFYSQQQEDVTLFKRYWESPLKKNGVFVELGGLDGVTYSNTKFFEEFLDWRGVLIEAVPSSFQKMIKNRPLANNFFMAICKEGNETEILGDWATAGIPGNMASGFRKTWHGSSNNVIKVPCGPISWVLKVSGIDHIDLFSIDVEGAELEVLETMDWSIKVHVICIEQDGWNKEKDEKCREILRKNGFTFVQKLHGNEIWENTNYYK